MAKSWYIIHTYSGFEKKVKESLEGRVAAFGLEEKIGRVMVPTEDVIEVRGGKKIVSPRMFYPGYVLVEMEMNDDTWHVVRSTPRVTGFVGSGQTPSPLSEEEVQAILNRSATPTEKQKPKLTFERNEQVTQIFMGRSAPLPWYKRFEETLVQQVVRKARDMQITIVAERRR